MTFPLWSPAQHPCSLCSGLTLVMGSVCTGCSLMVKNSGNSVDIIKPLDELCLGAEFIREKKERENHTYPHTSQKNKNNRRCDWRRAPSFKPKMELRDPPHAFSPPPERERERERERAFIWDQGRAQRHHL